MVKIKNTTITQNDIERFYDKINIITEGEYADCWEIDCYEDVSGYPNFCISYTHIPANRFMYLIHHQDENIENKLVCHKCDHPWCVNPDHLFLGTHKDNQEDKITKERQVKGETCGTSVLTEIDVINILDGFLNNKFKTISQVSKLYDIGITTVFNILKNNTWQHITKNYDLEKIHNIVKSNNLYGKKLTNDNIKEIKKRLTNKNNSFASIAREFNVSSTTIRKIFINNNFLSR
jgi:hypothetical protein